MVFGFTFNGSKIPASARKLFPAKKKFRGLPRGAYATLQGVCTNAIELNMMVERVTRRDRRPAIVHVETLTRDEAGRAPRFALYVCYASIPQPLKQLAA
jgi:hypothetical protein